MEENNKKRRKIDIVIEIILIIIIIILLLHSCGILKKNNNKIPTGNVDIIEIKCNSIDTCKKDNTNTDSKTLPVINPVNPSGSGDETEEENGFIVEDDYAITWDGSKNLKIFTNPAYEFQEKIAPESSNTYEFRVKNKTNYNLSYNIKFTETNPYSINLKYKLKKNGEYVINHYVSYDDLIVENQKIDINDTDTYHLEWKWISSDNDTKAGEIQANYKLKIDIKAESTHE